MIMLLWVRHFNGCHITCDMVRKTKIKQQKVWQIKTRLKKIKTIMGTNNMEKD